jgi:3-methyladenine DNA glycosylase AlkC
MAEAFKEWIGIELVRTMAKHLRRVHEGFPRERFVKLASTGLAELELKARVLHVADALAATLPSSFAQAAKILERSLAPPRSDADLSKLVPCDAGLAGWAVWPMTDYVARYGIKHAKRALRCLHALTQRNTAEYAIRPFLIEHRELTMATLHEWLDDESPHVRRLVSEGTRPRLPWGIQLRHLVADPTPAFPFLQQLQDDESEYVRRSVANHLNDIAKDHPGHVADWLERSLPDANDQRRSMLRHASRTLIKRADQRVLKAWGMANPLRGDATFSVSPTKVLQGDAATLSVVLQSRAKKSQVLMVDYVVHHVKKGGVTSAKTWKGWQLTLHPGECRELQKKHSLKIVTTRRDYPGRHAVDLMINGKVVASAWFDLAT